MRADSPDDEMTLDEAQALLGISFDATNREQIHGFLDVLPEGDRAVVGKLKSALEKNS